MLLFYFICFLLLNFLSPLTLSSIACPAPFSILLTSPLLSLFLSSYPSYHHSLSVSSLHFSIFLYALLLFFYITIISPHLTLPFPLLLFSHHLNSLLLFSCHHFTFSPPLFLFFSSPHLTPHFLFPDPLFLLTSLHYLYISSNDSIAIDVIFLNTKLSS
jgi:hypothetical protein